jgi:mono/diheme cytochrome c family protein
MLSAFMRRCLAAAAVLAVATLMAACGEEGIELAQDDPDYAGAHIFQQHCSGCHTLSAAGTQGSAVRVNSREYKDGPNFDQRQETKDQVLYAIQNGGFSSGPMPQDIVVGEDAEKVAAFVAKYSGSQRTTASQASTPEGKQPDAAP